MSVNWSTNESSVRLAGICCEGEVVFILDLLSGLRERATSLPGSCGEVVFISSLFQDCVRGQHLCLAHAERSSSHPKTNKYWGFVWLFPALNTNCNRLYSWKLEKNLLRPFCTHFAHPQSRILSPFEFQNKQVKVQTPSADLPDQNKQGLEGVGWTGCEEVGWKQCCIIRPAN